MNAVSREIQASSKVPMKVLAAMAKASANVLDVSRLRTLAPDNEKQTPWFTQTELADLLGKSQNWLQRRLNSGEEPEPVMEGRKLRFTLAMAQQWTRRHRPEKMRPEGQKGLVLSVGNFKGGSTKTTTAVTLAQGLSIFGHKVLVIDADPQASLSNLFGVLPELDSPPTLLPVCNGQLDSVESLIQPTYWSGVDLIAAAPMLAQADIELAGQKEYWQILSKALNPVLDRYDVVVIDTSPTLSPLSATAFMASDGMLMPVTPNALDFASSAQFWGMFSEMFSNFEAFGVAPKDFEFVKVLLSRVDPNDSATAMIRQFVTIAYGEQLMPVEIPKTNVATSASSAFGTVFDIQINKTSKATYQRAREAYQAFVLEIEKSLCAAWARREIEKE